MLLATAQPAWAGGGDDPYYGPMQRWHGIGYKFGYADSTESDGSWRVDVAIHGRGEAVDMALYRAAERARDEGYRYVFFLGGKGWRSPGISSATLYARPSHDAVPPTGCRSKKVTACYTADVAEVLRVLGGPGGTHPGVAIPDHWDRFGREVFVSGYGTGAMVAPVPGAGPGSHVITIVPDRGRAREVSAPTTLPPVARTARATSVQEVGVAAGYAAPAIGARFEEALKENKPVRGREPVQGWTISD
jgi:hypothetical protein